MSYVLKYILMTAFIAFMLIVVPAFIDSIFTQVDSIGSGFGTRLNGISKLGSY